MISLQLEHTFAPSLSRWPLWFPELLL